MFCQYAVPPNWDTRKYLDKLSGWERITNEARVARHVRCSAVPEIAKTVVTFPVWAGGKAPAFIMDTCASAFESVLIGDKTVQESMDAAKAKIDAKLKEA